MARHEPAHHLAQRQQIDRAKDRAARSNPPERVYRLDIGPSGSNEARPSVFIDINDPVLAPIKTPADQLELAAIKRMKGMRDPHPNEGRTHTTCS
jgi:hypothetical protein